jgi:antitoxin (DNA-binding transcriptional repressor) of toxin-antitoxin stability system
MGVSTISINELKEKPASQLVQAAGKEDVIVTSDGLPIALVLGLGLESLEATQSLVRSVRALQAQAALQRAALHDGTANLSDSNIDDEIAAVRKKTRG